MKRNLCTLLVTMLVPCAYAAMPGDSAAGKRLHDANCTKCHDSGVYTRKDRTIHSLTELRQQLDGCSHAINKEFSTSEAQDIIKYLNERYYHFQ